MPVKWSIPARCAALALAIPLAWLAWPETASAQVTEFSTPTASSSPHGIAAGPDGNLWFTESSSNKIGRITTAGVITEFTIPTADSQSLSIVAGPDGALWFTEFNTNKIGRISTAGIFT